MRVLATDSFQVPDSIYKMPSVHEFWLTTQLERGEANRRRKEKVLTAVLEKALLDGRQGLPAVSAFEIFQEFIERLANHKAVEPSS